MIDITVDDKEKKVEIDSGTYYFNTQWDMINLITQLLHKAKYSGESISLFEAQGDKKRLTEQW